MNKVILSPGYFPDPNSNRSLSNADIYVGEVDLDPEIPANQKTVSVLQENGAIVAVAQPISTSSGGVPIYNGSPVTMLVEGSYSLKVVNSYGAQVYYVPSSSTNDQLDSVVNVAALRALGYTPTDGAIAVLLGHTTENDGGGGTVYYDASSALPDDNGTVFLQTGHVGAGRWIRPHEYLTPDMFGGILTAGPEIRLLPKTYSLDAAKTFTDSVYKISGTLAVNTVAGAATSSASEIDAGTYAVSFGSAKTSFGLDLSGFLLSYSGAGAALTVDDFISTNIHDLFVDCNASAPYGINLTGNSFFSLLSNVTISRFTNTGLVLNSVGTKAVVRDCTITSSQDAAVAAIEINTAGATIQDGQADVGHAGDNTGIGVFFNNKTGATVAGGIVEGTLFEADTGIKITGTTHAFANVVVRNTRHTVGAGQLGVVFERAYNCVMENPTVVSPTGGTIATWGEHSIKCGLVGGFDACRSGISVHGSATQAYKICNEPILYSERANITTAANLTTTVEDCQYLGKTVHNGTAWDKSRDAITDDSFVAITPPKTVGSVKIQTTAGGGEYILANYNTTTGVTTALVTGGGCQVSATDGALNGTTGTDGYLTLRSYATDGKIYIENRRGSSRACVVVFE